MPSTQSTIAWALLVVTIALATAALGWWAVPLIGAAYGATRPSGRPSMLAASAAAIGWALLLALTATQGPVGELSTKLADYLGLPALALFILALVFPALLAGSAASLAVTIRDAFGSEIINTPGPVRTEDQDHGT